MGKPLISDAQMLAMHETMLQLQKAVPKRSGHAAQPAWPVAVLAAALMQLRTEDVLVTEGEQPLAEATLRQAQHSSFHPDLLPFRIAASAETAPALAASYAFAQANQARPGDHAPLTLALLSTQAPLSEVMHLAGQSMLPLLLIVREEPGRPRLPMTAPPNVEIVPVDAEDAIAVCRVMQESTMRARNRWGSVVLRAITLPNTADPVVSLEAHLRRRSLLPTGQSAMSAVPDGGNR